MKFAVKKIDLVKALTIVGGIVSRTTKLPILANTKIEYAPDGVILTGSDMDMEVAVKIAGNSTTPWTATTLPASKLSDIAKKSDDETLVIQSGKNEDSAKITSGRANYTLGTLPAGDFPEFPSSKASVTFTIEAAYIARLIDRVAYAQSDEETRYYLNGIYLHTVERPDNNGEVTATLRAVATDGHCLALADEPMALDVGGGNTVAGIILPRKAAAEIRKMLEDVTGVVTITISDHQFAITIGDISFKTKLVDGTYPDYERVIPKNNPIIATIEAPVLRAAVERTAAIAQKSSAIKLTFGTNELKLEVRGEPPNEAEESLEVETVGGEITIGFNSQYLTGSLAKVGGKATIEMSTPESPAIIRDPDDQTAFYIIMPLRV